MKFYSENIGQDGERDYLDTDDFKDVFFEKESFDCITEKATVTVNAECKLTFNEEEEKIGFRVEAKIPGTDKSLSSEVELDPIKLINQGVEVYYADRLLDDAEIIKKAKSECLNKIKSELVEEGYLLRGTNLDIIGIVKNNGNIIGIIDDITLSSEKTLTASKNYSIVSLSTVTAGTIEMMLSDSKKLVGQIKEISLNNDGLLNIEFTEGITTQDCEPFEYIKSSTFTNLEDYHADRAKYISIEDNVEEEFDDFDELF